MQSSVPPCFWCCSLHQTLQPSTSSTSSSSPTSAAPGGGDSASARPDSCCSPTKREKTQTAELESRMIQFWHDRIPPGPSWSRTGTRTTPLRSLNIVPRTLPPSSSSSPPPPVSGTQAGSAESSLNHLQQPLCHARRGELVNI